MAKVPLVLYKCINPLNGGRCIIPISTYLNVISTPVGGIVVEGDIQNKNCVLQGLLYTCTTRTTYKAE